MPHAVAMVGHGGFGTALLGLAAGVPMVVVPLRARSSHDEAAMRSAVVQPWSNRTRLGSKAIDDRMPALMSIDMTRSRNSPDGPEGRAPSSSPYVRG